MIGPAAAPLVLDTLAKLHGAATGSLRAKELAPRTRALHLFEPRRIGQHQAASVFRSVGSAMLTRRACRMP
jgi:hypothetical protein